MSDQTKDHHDKPATLAELSDTDAAVDRRCVCCGQTYSVAQFFSEQGYFGGACNYAQGCVTHCLGCWLGVGPAELEEQRELGTVLHDFACRLGPTHHLVLLPLIRVHSEKPVRLGSEVVLYPPGIDLSGLNIKDPDGKSGKLNEHISVASGVDLHTIQQHATVAFAAKFEWDATVNVSHGWQMRLLRRLSRFVDESCLNLIRYRYCRLDVPDSLPGRAGQLYSNPMMAGVVLYNAARQQGQVIGGAAFTHLIVKGLGLDISGLSDNEFPQNGEVGCIVRRALNLYKTVLESDDDSTKYIHALSLLDFLAEPSDFAKSKQIAQRIAPYASATHIEYEHKLRRFAELYTELRTRIVHRGESLEDILPKTEDRAALFKELAFYIGKVLDDMIGHSFLSWDEYADLRRTRGTFMKVPSNA